MDIKQYKQKLLKDETFKEEYENYDLPFEISNMVLEARLIKGLTQLELAEKVGTKQASIARLENSTSLPSLRFLAKIAKDGFKSYLMAPRFAFMESTPKVQCITTFSDTQREGAFKWIANTIGLPATITTVGIGIQQPITVCNSASYFNNS